MWLAPTGAAGGRTWYVARALQLEARVHGRVAGISWPLDLVRVFTHGRRTGPCAIARAPGPTAKARVSLQTTAHYVAVEALAAVFRATNTSSPGYVDPYALPS